VNDWITKDSERQREEDSESVNKWISCELESEGEEASEPVKKNNELSRQWVREKQWISEIVNNRGRERMLVEWNREGGSGSKSVNKCVINLYIRKSEEI